MGGYLFIGLLVVGIGIKIYNSQSVKARRLAKRQYHLNRKSAIDSALKQKKWKTKFEEKGWLVREGKS